MGMLKGITVTLYDKTLEGKDAFFTPVYRETPIEIQNVLVSPISSEDVIGDLQLYGKRAVYELSIPKEDAHVWEDRVVEFFGHKWKTYGFCREWIPENIPLCWNKKIRVERYGG